MLKEIEILLFIGIILFVNFMVYKVITNFKKDNTPKVITEEESTIDALITQLKVKIDVAAIQTQENVEGAQTRLDKLKEALLVVEKRKEQFKEIN